MQKRPRGRKANPSIPIGGVVSDEDEVPILADEEYHEEIVYTLSPIRRSRRKMTPEADEEVSSVKSGKMFGTSTDPDEILTIDNHVQIMEEFSNNEDIEIEGAADVLESISSTLKAGETKGEPKNQQKRKRKILSSSGEWIYEHEIDGRTIEHKHAAPIRKSSRKQGKKISEESWEINPFRLVPAQDYGGMAPFEVIVAPQVLITMDFHAHLSVAEVIGLLGGRFDPVDRKLYVLSIFPCNSIGSRKECEMDPISEMEAVQIFFSMGLTPVGWYHSHPTFEPSPSCRDIETQTMYQTLFNRAHDNAEPFLGFIISPFLKHSKGRSVIECIHLAPFKAQDEDFRLPCRVDYKIEESGEFFEHSEDLVDLFQRLQRIYSKTTHYAGYYQHDSFFINKLAGRLEGTTYEPSARVLLQRFRNKMREQP